ncbi:MAG TPA: hypothetical protein VN802_23605 [Stellaceae bacterium]|nr:hypothetical protein [Stellaceae bacterium]
MRRAFTLSLALVLCVGVAAAAEPGDTRPLAGDEEAAFLPLLCQKPVAQKGGEHACAGFVGYPGGAQHGASLSLTAIAVGPFSAQNADEAYITYFSMVEPHANNFGGGVLLRRAKGAWRLVRWYPGGQMGDCIALPGDGPRRMLCRDGYTGMGEIDSSVWIKRLPFDHDQAVLKAQDQRGAGVPCPSGRGQALLLSIDKLKRSDAPDEVAVAEITYLAPQDFARACGRGDFSGVAETKGEVKFALRNGRVTAIAPLKFAPTDY